jgi:hypothetical protein
MLATVVMKGPLCIVARDALRTLESAYDMFREASQFGGRSVSLLVSVQFLSNRI